MGGATVRRWYIQKDYRGLVDEWAKKKVGKLTSACVEGRQQPNGESRGNNEALEWTGRF